MKLLEVLTPKLKWADLIKKYNMVNGPHYHGGGGSPKQIKSAHGEVVVEIDIRKAIISESKFVKSLLLTIRIKLKNLAILLRSMTF